MKKIIALVLVLVLTLGLVACTAKSDKKTIAVIAKGESHAFWQTVKAGAEKAAAEKGYVITFRGPANEDPSSVPAQMEYVQTALSTNVDGIVLATIGSGFGDMLTQAYEKNIPVVTFDSGLKAPDDITAGKNPIVAHVATNNKTAAAIDAQKMFEAVKAEIAKCTEAAPYVVGVIQHDETSTGVDRSTGFIDEFKKLADADTTTKGKYKIEKEVKPSDANQAYKEALEALYQKNIKALFMTNEGVVKQVYDAAKAADGKYDHIVFAGFDAGTKQLTWMKENGTLKLLGAVAQDSYNMGYQAVLQCIAAIEGGKAENKDIDAHWYDISNMMELVEKNLAYADSDADRAAILGK